MPEVIRSATNPLIKRIRLLGDRRHRRRQGAFIVEGIQPVSQAVAAGVEIEVLIVAPGLLRGPANEMVADQAARGVRVARLSDDLFSRIAEREGPTGLAAIVRMRLRGLDKLIVSPYSVFVALHEVGNPGNLGSIIRTAEAAGAAGVILVGSCTDPFDPTAVKASMGALFSVPVVTSAKPEEFLKWCAARSVSLAVTSAKCTGEFWDVPLQMPVALLLGSEGAGLPDQLLSAGDVRLRIPMTGTAESLNLSVAAGILIYEVWRQRRERSRKPGG